MKSIIFMNQILIKLKAWWNKKRPIVRHQRAGDKIEKNFPPSPDWKKPPPPPMPPMNAVRIQNALNVAQIIAKNKVHTIKINIIIE